RRLELTLRRAVLRADELDALGTQHPRRTAVARNHHARHLGDRDATAFAPTDALGPGLLELADDGARRKRSCRAGGELASCDRMELIGGSTHTVGDRMAWPLFQAAIARRRERSARAVFVEHDQVEPHSRLGV